MEKDNNGQRMDFNNPSQMKDFANKQLENNIKNNVSMVPVIIIVSYLAISGFIANIVWIIQLIKYFVK